MYSGSCLYCPSVRLTRVGRVGRGWCRPWCRTGRLITNHIKRSIGHSTQSAVIQHKHIQSVLPRDRWHRKRHFLMPHVRCSEQYSELVIRDNDVLVSKDSIVANLPLIRQWCANRGETVQPHVRCVIGRRLHACLCDERCDGDIPQDRCCVPLDKIPGNLLVFQPQRTNRISGLCPRQWVRKIIPEIQRIPSIGGRWILIVLPNEVTRSY